MMNPQLGRLGSVSPSLLNGGSAGSLIRGDLVDFFTFKGKGNTDLDRTTVKGLLENVLTLTKFSFNLNSGYGLFTENYLTYNKAQNVFVTDDHSITIVNFVPANIFAVFRYDTDPIKATKVRVTGLTATDQLTYEYSPSDGGSRVVFPIPEDGEYDLPESIQKSSGDPGYNVGFAVRGALTKNVTIEQVNPYPGAIVTNGINNYLKLGKTGYKIGTVIIKFVPIKFNVGWNTVFDNNRYDTPNRNYLGYSSTIENRGTTMFVSEYGDYLALYYKATPKQADDSLYIGSSYTETFVAKEFFSMALFEMAIYSEILTAEEIQKEITENFPLYTDYILNR